MVSEYMPDNLSISEIEDHLMSQFGIYESISDLFSLAPEPTITENLHYHTLERYSRLLTFANPPNANCVLLSKGDDIAVVRETLGRQQGRGSL